MPTPPTPNPFISPEAPGRALWTRRRPRDRLPLLVGAGIPAFVFVVSFAFFLLESLTSTREFDELLAPNPAQQPLIRHVEVALLVSGTLGFISIVPGGLVGGVIWLLRRYGRAG
jgi:hypothetical protein